jgi:hypothetical protein
MHSCTAPLHLGDGMSGHVEQIEQRRGRGTWCAWIQAVDGIRWARWESDPLKSYEKTCVE